MFRQSDSPLTTIVDKAPYEISSGLSFMHLPLREFKSGRVEWLQEIYGCWDSSQIAFRDPLTSLPMTSSGDSLGGCILFRKKILYPALHRY